MTQQATPKNPVDAFIGELGGTVKVANALDLPPSTVSSWRISGRIPRWRIAGLVNLAVKLSVQLPTDLVASPRRAAA